MTREVYVGDASLAGTLTIDDGAPITLEQKQNGDATWLEGGSGLSNQFIAAFDVTLGGESYKGKIRYATSYGKKPAPATQPAGK